MSAAPTFLLPLWAEILVAFFAICGGLISLLGASGVLRLQTFFARIHAPALITTGGVWCLMLATIIYFSFQTGKPAINILLLGLFIAITSPVTTIFLMRAALFRSRQKGENVPRSVNMLQLAVPRMAPEKDDDEQDEEQEKPQAKPTQASNATDAEEEKLDQLVEDIGAVQDPEAKDGSGKAA
ncbi:Na+/H+ antiporter subunit G [Lampropedia aestuarii]|uniref:Na+/H+ antiporter subunit G n=1 Tax=Lampropedia aestuarii TaxID=2562762 RepID=A0A4S5BPW0_9BURK|nr:Na+/H+ antiporter subunit G [Lampropedia aestuarii]